MQSQYRAIAIVHRAVESYTDFKFGRYIEYIHRVQPNKSPLKILEKRERGRIQGLPNFFLKYPLLSQERVKQRNLYAHDRPEAEQKPILKISGKVRSCGRTRVSESETLQNFQGTQGVSRDHLCDSSAFLFYVRCWLYSCMISVYL